MRHHKIEHPEGKGHYSLVETDDFEYSNPIQKYSELFVMAEVAMLSDHIELRQLDPPIELLVKNAVNSWDKKYKEIMQLEVPDAFFELLNNPKKKEQLQLLKSAEITTWQFMSFIMKAYLNYGYTFSQYRASHHHKGLDESDIPRFIHKEDDDSIVKVGETKLTDGQLKQIVEHHKIIVSRFLDKGDDWHCFFHTLDSINGKENYQGGQPHMHYISSKWGIKRALVLEQLKSRNYSLPQLPHIHYGRENRE
ncbi:hypothetical protein [Marinoscillum pacificum]|uniref:hypothetical protein n=1 Tax=Marinoscillum pacificum TaxID=392723 RepID=UPI002157BF07|nr:hypothetical protein [Marinoscillum pacificum]